MNLEHTKTGVIYCRVSSVEQVEGTSLTMQKEACRAYCKKNGIAKVTPKDLDDIRSKMPASRIFGKQPMSK